MNKDIKDAITRLELLGGRGYTVSIAFGPTAGSGICYSVNVLNNKLESFGLPYVADSFSQCIDIAENEIKERGW